MSDNFGRIAIGVRCGFSPDPVFLTSWTHLILGNLRTGDRVLSPCVELPVHHAANTLAFQFLESECDTLLMLDDDMTFECEKLTKLRDNLENHEYGIVQGLCCSRRPPNAPIVLLPGDIEETYRPAKPEAGVGPDTIEVAMVGLAFTLIRRTVFEAVDKQRAGDELYFHWGKNGRGEDADFCLKARRAGAKIGVYTSVAIGHRMKVEAIWNLEKGETEYRAYGNPNFLEMLKEQGERVKNNAERAGDKQ